MSLKRIVDKLIYVEETFYAHNHCMISLICGSQPLSGISTQLRGFIRGSNSEGKHDSLRLGFLLDFGKFCCHLFCLYRIILHVFERCNDRLVIKGT